jgi:endonuclease-3 related protein
MNKIQSIYKELFKKYGPQGWWPLLELQNKIKIKITKSGSLKGYHPIDYSYPKTENQIFEVCIGAILTQNSAWGNAEKALLNLKKLNALNAQRMQKLNIAKLKNAIKPAGYFNQKAKKIKIFTDFFIKLDGRIPSRHELLDVWGIGNETADSILLYAYKQPEFVVDAYTRRIFFHLGLTKEKATYHEIKELFEKNLPKDFIVYQEYHALLVEHAKRYYSRKPYGKNDPFIGLITSFSLHNLY